MSEVLCLKQSRYETSRELLVLVSFAMSPSHVRFGMVHCTVLLRKGISDTLNTG